MKVKGFVTLVVRQVLWRVGQGVGFVRVDSECGDDGLVREWRCKGCRSRWGWLGDDERLREGNTFWNLIWGLVLGGSSGGGLRTGLARGGAQ